jgi:hypothetical protein
MENPDTPTQPAEGATQSAQTGRQQRKKKEDSPESESGKLETIEHWAATLEVPTWLVAAASAKHRWPLGLEITRADFESALEAAETEEVR